MRRKEFGVDVKRHGQRWCSNVNFKGFMCDSAQANFNAVKVLFGSGDPKVSMENRERTRLF